MNQSNKNNLKKTNLILIILVILISAFPLFFNPEGSEFGGTDSQGSALIEKEHPNYEVWFNPVWEPPSGEIESLFFALQAALGAGVVGYALGYLKGRKINNPTENIKPVPDKVIAS
jgi:cobalt/nickel transport protein